jgi:hypothetical protein
MWSLTSPCTNRISCPKNFRSSGKRRLFQHYLPVAEVAKPFDQRTGVRPGLDRKRGPVGKGGSNLMQRPVKAQPKIAQDFTGRFESKK